MTGDDFIGVSGGQHLQYFNLARTNAERRDGGIISCKAFARLRGQAVSDPDAEDNENDSDAGYVKLKGPVLDGSFVIKPFQQESERGKRQAIKDD